jgi:carboxyl-terminal processing protease
VFREVASGETISVDLTSQEITSTPVQSVKAIPLGNSKVGYLLFNDHIATAEAQLIEAFEGFQSEGVTELVLDMRYNGGGYLDIARMLASMIAGQEAIGQTFSELKFNSKYPTQNPITGRTLSPSRFASTAPGFVVSSETDLPLLNLNRVVVISGSGTCSASEAVINGLRGIGVEVILIGDTTCGKPYGFYGIDNCGTTYFTIQFKGVNASGFGDYTDGFSPPGAENVGVEVGGCAVDDDLSQALGNPDEARLATALEYLSSGSCQASAAGVNAKRRHPLSSVRGQVVKAEPLTGGILRTLK